MARGETPPQVYYGLGLAKNPVRIGKLTPALVTARMRHCLCGAPSVREFAEFEYQTQPSWSRPRRVVGKAEVLAGGDNPRFIVTNLPAQGFKGDEDRQRFTPQRLYEELYCARGEMENVLKQQVLDLAADKLSTHFLASNQLRLGLASFAYLPVERLRALGCHGTELARATVGSLRLKLLKVAARVTDSVRRVYVQFSSAYPRPDLFRPCHARLMRLAAADGSPQRPPDPKPARRSRRRAERRRAPLKNADLAPVTLPEPANGEKQDGEPHFQFPLPEKMEKSVRV